MLSLKYVHPSGQDIQNYWKLYINVLNGLICKDWDLRFSQWWICRLWSFRWLPMFSLEYGSCIFLWNIGNHHQDRVIKKTAIDSVKVVQQNKHFPWLFCNFIMNTIIVFVIVILRYVNYDTFWYILAIAIIPDGEKSVYSTSCRIFKISHYNFM
jgi:hypothetical protein